MLIVKTSSDSSSMYPNLYQVMYVSRENPTYFGVFKHYGISI